VSEDVAIPTVNRPDRLDLDATPSWKGVLEALPRPARDPSVGAIVVTVGTARSAWVAPIFSDSWALTATIPLPAPVTVAVLEAISNIPFPPASRSFMAIRALVLDRRGFNPDPPFSGCTSVDTLRARSWATSALCHRRRALPVRGAGTPKSDNRKSSHLYRARPPRPIPSFLFSPQKSRSQNASARRSGAAVQRHFATRQTG
jgi:hypothetical protein